MLEFGMLAGNNNKKIRALLFHQTKPNQTNQIKPSSTKPNITILWSNQTKPNQTGQTTSKTKPKERKRTMAKLNQTKPNQTKIKLNQMKPYEERLKKVKKITRF